MSSFAFASCGGGSSKVFSLRKVVESLGEIGKENKGEKTLKQEGSRSFRSAFLRLGRGFEPK